MRKIFLIIFLFLSMSIAAAAWQNFFSTPNQRGMKAYTQKDYEKAAELFKDSQWAGSANYQAGHYQAALEAFAKEKTATADYNQGNALAKLKQYPQAIAAYESALKKDPHFADAAFNKKSIEDFLKKQKQQQKDNKQQENQQQQKDSKQQEKQQQQQQEQKNQQNQKNQQQQNQQQENKERLTKNSFDQTKDPQKQSQQQEKNMQAQNNLQEKKINPDVKNFISAIPDDPGGLLRAKFRLDWLARHGDVT